MATLHLPETPLGPLWLRASAAGLCAAGFGAPPDDADPAGSAVLARAGAELERYLAGQRVDFALPLDLAGTEFQRAVWAELCAIPWGQTRTYGELAARLGKPGASRAVGLAAGENPLPIVVPCHRLVAAGGKLGGFSAGIERKKRLLMLEAGPFRLA